MARGDGNPLAPWRELLLLNDEGNPRVLLANVMTILRADEKFNRSLGFDKLQTATMATGPLPWDRNITEPREWRDNDDRMLTEWMQNEYIYAGIPLVAEAVQAVAFERAYHPVMNYLESLEENGDELLDRWAIEYLGVKDTPYVRTVSRKWMISAVARIYQPGCKADCAIVLEGRQGAGKSPALRVLGQPWFTDEIAAFGTKDASEQTIGVWIVELSELDAVTRAADVAHVKAFMSRQIDRFRMPYGRRTGKYPRQCVFAATTNSVNWNRDDTGGRRWWPLACGTINIEGLRQARDQLWAEARGRYLAGETWWLDDETTMAEAAEIVEERQPEDPWEAAIFSKIVTLFVTSTSDVMEQLGIPKDRQTRAESMRIASILRKFGWGRKREWTGRRMEWQFRAPTPWPPTTPSR